MEFPATRYDIVEVKIRMRELLSPGPMDIDELRRNVCPPTETPDQARQMKFSAMSLIEEGEEFTYDEHSGLVDWTRR